MVYYPNPCDNCFKKEKQTLEVQYSLLTFENLYIYRRLRNSLITDVSNKKSAKGTILIYSDLTPFTPKNTKVEI